MNCEKCEREMEIIANQVTENNDNLITYQCEKCKKVRQEEK